ADQARNRGHDAELEVDDRKLPELAAASLQQPTEGGGVSGLVCSLAGNRHPQLPYLIGKVDEVARRHLDGVDLLVHLPSQEFEIIVGIVMRQVGQLVPAILADETVIARRIVGEQLRIERHASASALASPGTMERYPAWRRISWISSSENSA